MRPFRFEFLAGVALLGLSYGLLDRVAHAEDGEGEGWKCQGSTNCKGQDCVRPSPTGFSCAELTAIDHPKCEFTGNYQDECAIVSQDCVKIQDFIGGACDEDDHCEGSPINDPYTVQEAGCASE